MIDGVTNETFRRSLTDRDFKNSDVTRIYFNISEFLEFDQSYNIFQHIITFLEGILVR